MLAASLILIIPSLFFLSNWFSYIFLLLGLLLFFFTIWFFRDPERNIPEEAKNNSAVILSPADGKVVEICEEFEKNYLKENSLRISIFLSPLDVHVNRCPVSGRVEFFSYTPGDYLVAYHPKSSELNEQTSIGVKTEYGKLLFKQIVGILARRLVCEIKEGDEIQIGERFGMMKFGSRMDINVPLSTKINIKVGDRVKAGETILAYL